MSPLGPVGGCGLRANGTPWLPGPVRQEQQGRCLMLDYMRRDATLRDMGYPSYKAYLASPLWKSIRAKVIERAHGKCHICGGKATEVHHRLYWREVLDGRWLNNLNAVCRTCHELGEFGDEGQKVSMREANRRLTRFRKPKPGQCTHCKMNIVRKGHSLCRKCKRIIARSRNGGTAQGHGKECDAVRVRAT